MTNGKISLICDLPLKKELNKGILKRRVGCPKQHSQIASRKWCRNLKAVQRSTSIVATGDHDHNVKLKQMDR